MREGPLGELRIPLTWGAVIAAIVAVIVAVTLVTNARRTTIRQEAYGATRKAVDTVAAPVGTVLSTSGRVGNSLGDGISNYWFAGSQNAQLKAELLAMRRWKDRALALQDVNDRYRALLDLKIEPAVGNVSARTLFDSHGPFAHSRLVDVGSASGVENGNPVMSDRGLVGRVTGTASNLSRVLLLTDASSRVPVMVDRNNMRAMLVGDGSGTPRLDYVRGATPLKPGDRIVTSGDGGIFPRGLPIGRAGRTSDGNWRVVLDSDEDTLDFVKVILYKDFRVDANSLPKPVQDMPPVGNLIPPPLVIKAQPAAPTIPPAQAAPPQTSPALKAQAQVSSTKPPSIPAGPVTAIPPGPSSQPGAAVTATAPPAAGKRP
jgi:rod shape-determining protein MreC